VLVFTNGVFDVLHAGHVQLLTQAKNLGDLLCVGINTDESVRSLHKGNDRPINCLEDRMAVLNALKSVDFVITFDEKTPESVIREIEPDIHVKGGDYKLEDLPEAHIVLEYGGKIEILPLKEGLSTSNTLRRMRNDDCV